MSDIMNPITAEPGCRDLANAEISAAAALTRRRVRQGLLISLGVLATIIGVVGIVIPLVPTTPLLLLAAACFVRSSDRMYQWLIGNRLFGPIIYNYRQHRAIALRSKVAALVMLWGVIGYTALAATSAVWLRLLLVSIAIGVTLHLLRLRTLKTPT
jgi:hypothetical protein